MTGANGHADDMMDTDGDAGTQVALPGTGTSTSSNSYRTRSVCIAEILLHFSSSESDRASRGQKVLPDSRGDVWTGRRNARAGGGCAAVDGADCSADQGQEVSGRGEGYAGD